MQQTITDMEVVVDKSGYQELRLTSDTSHLEIRLDERINASMMITYSGVKADVSTRLILPSNSSLTMMIRNELKEELRMQIHGSLYRDAELHFAYCDLDHATVDMQAEFELKEEGANAEVKSACIVHGEKKFVMNCVHLVPYTRGIMEHYAVVGENGRYCMEACGKIVKGAHDAASHQTTRVLTMSEQHTSQVVPLLLIDENDVKASHATTLGQPDENQLYYLQTRGLTRKQALGLLSIGYIMPIAEFFDDEEKNAQLKNEIEMKVGLHV